MTQQVIQPKAEYTEQQTVQPKTEYLTQQTVQQKPEHPQPVLQAEPQPLPQPPPVPTPVVPPAPTIQLSPEQQQVLNMVKTGKNVFFTGSAGTGKSVLLREIIKWCRGQERTTAVTATTGIASINIGGSTVHSWAGIGVGLESAEKLVAKILGQEKYKRMKDRQARRDQGLPSDDEDGGWQNDRQPRVVQRWRSCRTLIIDESAHSTKPMLFVR